MKLFDKKKGQASIGDLPNLALGLGIAAIVIGVVMLILSNVGDNFTANSAEANATADAVSGLSEVSSQFPTIGVIIGAVVIISLVIGGFAFARRR